MRSAITSSSAIVSSAAVATTCAQQCRAFSSTPARLQHEKVFLNKYQKECYENIQAMKRNTTYPGPIRAATPGDTKHAAHGINVTLNARDRNYWRPVVDDLAVEDNSIFRVRFKDDVWVTSRWETRMHTIEVSVSKTATIGDLIRELTLANRHPHLIQNPFVIAHDDKVLPNSAVIADCGINEMSPLYALDTVKEHIEHLPEAQLKDYNIDEITEADLRDPTKRYRDWGLHGYEGNARGRPSYQAAVAKKWNYGRF